MTGRGNNQENARYSQPKFPAQVRPPEDNPTTIQNAPNKEGDHSQTGTNRNSKHDPAGKADQRTEDVWQHMGPPPSETQKAGPTPNGHMRDTSPRRNVEASGASEPAKT